MAAEELEVREMAVNWNVERVTLQHWGKWWRARAGKPLVGQLRDALHPRTPPTFKPEQICEITALARESPSGSVRPFTQRTQRRLDEASIGGGLVKRARVHSLQRFLREVKVKCHRIRGWMNTLADADFAAKCHDDSETFRRVPVGAAVWVEVHSVDEISGARTSERAAPTPSIGPRYPGRGEFECIHPGSITLIADCDMATGATGFRLGSTRTGGDCPQHLAALPTARSPETAWHVVEVSLNFHRFGAVVRQSAKAIGFAGDLGVPGQCGILNRMVLRERYLRRPTQRSVPHFTPNHASWLSQIQMEFLIVAQKVIRRGNFTSLDGLHAKIADLVNFFSKIQAETLRWTHNCKPWVYRASQLFLYFRSGAPRNQRRRIQRGAVMRHQPARVRGQPTPLFGDI